MANRYNSDALQAYKDRLKGGVRQAQQSLAQPSTIGTAQDPRLSLGPSNPDGSYGPKATPSPPVAPPVAQPYVEPQRTPEEHLAAGQANWDAMTTPERAMYEAGGTYRPDASQLALPQQQGRQSSQSPFATGGVWSGQPQQQGATQNPGKGGATTGQEVFQPGGRFYNPPQFGNTWNGNSNYAPQNSGKGGQQQPSPSNSGKGGSQMTNQQQGFTNMLGGASPPQQNTSGGKGGQQQNNSPSYKRPYGGGKGG